MSLIKLEHVHKIYGQDGYQTVAVDDVNLEVNAGEFVAIIGPSGSGKSTLMHIMGLLDHPTEGSYELEGKSVASLSETARAHLRLKKVGFVFQTFNLLGRNSALDNVILPMVYAGKSRAAREKRAQELLEKVGLGDRMRNMPSELSGGQVQRVAIARALANDPDIIFADEPTGNLDSKSGAQILELLQKLNKDGVTMVLVTHDPQIAAAAKRTVSMLDGRVVSDTGARKKSSSAKKKPAKKAAKKTLKRKVARKKS